MPRQRKSFERPAPFSDASLAVIAAEGAETEFQYFTGLRDFIHSRRINLIPIQRDKPNRSAPHHVIESMDDWVDKNLREDGDRLFIVIDRDRWGDSQISEAAKSCQDKGYELIVSNPCFELWLLLHFENLSTLSPSEIQEFMTNRKVTAHLSYLKKRLQRHVSGYTAAALDFSQFCPYLEKAIGGAKLLEANDSRGRWPQGLGTRVHIPVEHVLQFER